MNKAELIAKIAETTGTSKKEAEGTINLVVDTIIAGAKTDGECVIPSLGKLAVVDVAARSGVAMGKAWSKPAGKALKLKLSKAGKELV